MECEESGASSLGPEQQEHELRQEVGRACRRLKELSSHLRRGEDDSGLQSDCDESMLVLNNSSESEVIDDGDSNLPRYLDKSSVYYLSS